MRVTGERGASPLPPGLRLQPTLPQEQTDLGVHQLRAVTVTLSKSLTRPPPSLLLPVRMALGTPPTKSSGGEDMSHLGSSSRCGTHQKQWYQSGLLERVHPWVSVSWDSLGPPSSPRSQSRPLYHLLKQLVYGRCSHHGGGGAGTGCCAEVPGPPPATWQRLPAPRPAAGSSEG